MGTSLFRTSFLVGGDGSSQANAGGAPAGGGNGAGRGAQHVAQQLGLGDRRVS